MFKMVFFNEISSDIITKNLNIIFLKSAY